MKKSNAKRVRKNTGGRERGEQGEGVALSCGYGAYVGLDVHKETIAVAVAYAGRGEAEYRGEIRNTGKALEKLIKRLSADGEVVSFCYEAGPCGYGVYRQIVGIGHDCEVVAPSLIPRKAGDRVKTDRVAAVGREMEASLAQWSLAPVVEGLMALRGVDLVTAMTVVAELGDISRFEHPRQLMGYLGLVPSEHSSGPRRRRGGITKTGNSHARRALVEAAWSYRFPARKTAHLQRRAEKTSAQIQAIAWKAQKRLCARYQRLIARGKLTVQACTAVARELAGFIWAIVCAVLGRSTGVATPV